MSSWWISAGVAFAPKSSEAASPGRKFITMKVSSVTPNSTGIAAASLRPMSRTVGARDAARSPCTRPRPEGARNPAGAEALTAAPASAGAQLPVRRRGYPLSDTSSQSTLAETTTAGSGVVRPGPDTLLAATCEGAQEK